MPIDIEQIKRNLVARGVLNGPDVEASALTGGVSSDIHLFSDGHRKVVVKQAALSFK